MAHGLTTPITTTAPGTIETALVKNADGSAISNPSYVDCTDSGTAVNGQKKWVCAVEAAPGTYPAGAQKFRVKGSVAATDIALSVTAGVVVAGLGNPETDGPAIPAGTPTAVTQFLTGIDSLSEGYVNDPNFVGATYVRQGGVTLAVQTTLKYMQDVLGTTYYQYIQAGRSGATTADYTTKVYAEILSQVNRITARQSLFIIQAGANDTNLAPADEFALVKALANFVVAHGTQVLLVSNTPTGSQRKAFADYLRAHWQETNAIKFVDLGGDSRVQDTTNAVYYQPDNLHYTLKLNQLAANQYAPQAKDFALNFAYPAANARTTEPIDWTVNPANITVAGTTVTATAAGAFVCSSRQMAETTPVVSRNFAFKISDPNAKGFVGVGNLQVDGSLAFTYTFYLPGNGQITPYQGSGLESSSAGSVAIAAGDICEIRLTATGVQWWINGVKSAAAGDKPLLGGPFYAALAAINSGFSIKEATLSAGLYTATPGAPGGMASVEAMNWVDDGNTTSTTSGDLLRGSATTGRFGSGAHSTRTANQPTAATDLVIGTYHTFRTVNEYMIGVRDAAKAHDVGQADTGLLWGGPGSNGLAIWANGVQTSAVLVAFPGDEAGTEVYSDRIDYVLNGAVQHSIAQANAASYYVQASFGNTGSASSFIKHAYIKGANLSGVAGASVPAVVTPVFSTVDVAWTPTGGTPTITGNTIAATTNSDAAISTTKFEELTLRSPGLRASISVIMKVGKGGYFLSISDGISLFVTGDNKVNAYAGGTNNNQYAYISDGDTATINVYNDRVEFLLNATLLDSKTVVRPFDLRPSVSFLNATGVATNVVMSGLNIVTAQ